ncbi:probable calcium-binding protein CML23 [Actinidia eriantha]|uniref:probable calcium-binding protein CML23 n=1 Tax=Actinidia eriantha TaxID=165200 RepID=UPI002590F05A|nr:probable calcium-binding protein CML23 [Actinidia eriantha]
MPDLFASCLRGARIIVHQLKSMTKIKCGKRKNPNRPFSDFAALEVPNQLKQVFDFFDSNRDGKISPSEICEVLLTFGHDKSAATKEAEGMLREMDFNGDGFVDLDEFVKVVDIAHEESDLMDVFLVFDSDKNGFISDKELLQVLVSLGSDKCSLRECRRMIRGVDKDGDGFVDFEEFRSMMRG